MTLNETLKNANWSFLHRPLRTQVTTNGLGRPSQSNVAIASREIFSLPILFKDESIPPIVSIMLAGDIPIVKSNMVKDYRNFEGLCKVMGKQAPHPTYYSTITGYGVPANQEISRIVEDYFKTSVDFLVQRIGVRWPYDAIIKVHKEGDYSNRPNRTIFIAESAWFYHHLRAKGKGLGNYFSEQKMLQFIEGGYTLNQLIGGMISEETRRTILIATNYTCLWSPFSEILGSICDFEIRKSPESVQIPDYDIAVLAEAVSEAVTYYLARELVALLQIPGANEFMLEHDKYTRDTYELVPTAKKWIHDHSQNSKDGVLECWEKFNENPIAVYRTLQNLKPSPWQRPIFQP